MSSDTERLLLLGLAEVIDLLSEIAHPSLSGALGFRSREVADAMRLAASEKEMA